jgi:hypothetical protein
MIGEKASDLMLGLSLPAAKAAPALYAAHNENYAE